MIDAEFNSAEAHCLIAKLPRSRQARLSLQALPEIKKILLVEAVTLDCGRFAPACS
jgi:hypothetical protein